MTTKEESARENRSMLLHIEGELYRAARWCETDREGLYKWFNDNCLDIEYIIDSSGRYIGARVYITLGGPTIWIDTRESVIEMRWARETDKTAIHYGVTNALDEILSDCYEQVRI